MPDTRYTVHASGAPAPVSSYSPGVVAHGILFTAGQIALDPRSNELIDGGVEAQVTQTLDNLEAVASSAGVSLREHGVRITVYVLDLETNWPAVNAAYERWFESASPPARATVGVAQLALGAAVEMDAILALP